MEYTTLRMMGRKKKTHDYLSYAEKHLTKFNTFFEKNITQKIKTRRKLPQYNKEHVLKAHS